MNPDILEIEISNKIILIWQSILFSNKYYESYSLTNEITKIPDFEEKEASSLEESERVKVFDIIRTRVRERKTIPKYESVLNFLIDNFLKNEKLSYKQGMNEVFGGFLFIKMIFLESLTLSTIYNLASAFIKKFLTNFYSDHQSLYTLKSSFVLITILLRYHDPELYRKLKITEISPELYSTSWIITYFFSKLKLDNLFYFINLVILQNDEKLIFYLIVATLMFFRNEIIGKEKSMLPYFFSNLSLSKNTDIIEILKKALKLRSNTPESFNLLVNKMKIFNPMFINHKEIFEKSKIANLDHMPILTSELLKLCYSNQINCFDDYCENYLVDKRYSKACQNNYSLQQKDTQDSKSTNSASARSSIKLKLCEYCKEKLRMINKYSKSKQKHESSTKFCEFNVYNSNKNYIIIDLKDETNCQFVLPMSLVVSENKYFSGTDLVKKFKNEKGNYHFIVITENTEILQKFKVLNKLRYKVSKLTRKLNTEIKYCKMNSDNNEFGSSSNLKIQKENIEKTTPEDGYTVNCLGGKVDNDNEIPIKLGNDAFNKEFPGQSTGFHSTLEYINHEDSENKLMMLEENSKQILKSNEYKEKDKHITFESGCIDINNGNNEPQLFKSTNKPILHEKNTANRNQLLKEIQTNSNLEGNSISSKDKKVIDHYNTNSNIKLNQTISPSKLRKCSSNNNIQDKSSNIQERLNVKLTSYLSNSSLIKAKTSEKNNEQHGNETNQQNNNDSFSYINYNCDENYIKNLILNCKVSKEEKNYLLFKEVMHEFLQNNFMYVSFAFKGFIDIHNKCVKYNLTVANHSNKKNKDGGFYLDKLGYSLSVSYLNRVACNLLNDCSFCQVLARDLGFKYKEVCDNHHSHLNSNSSMIETQRDSITREGENYEEGKFKSFKQKRGFFDKITNLLDFNFKKKDANIEILEKNEKEKLKKAKGKDSEKHDFHDNKANNNNATQSKTLNYTKDSNIHKHQNHNEEIGPRIKQKPHSIYMSYNSKIMQKESQQQSNNPSKDNDHGNCTGINSNDNTNEVKHDGEKRPGCLNKETTRVSALSGCKNENQSDTPNIINSNSNGNEKNNNIVENTGLIKESLINLNSNNTDKTSSSLNPKSQFPVNSNSINNFTHPTLFNLNETKELLVECYSKNLHNDKIEDLVLYFYNDLFAIFLKVENGEYLPVDINMNIDKISSLFLYDYNYIEELEGFKFKIAHEKKNSKQKGHICDNDFADGVEKSIKYRVILSFFSSWTNTESEVVLLFSNYSHIENLSKRINIKIERI